MKELRLTHKAKINFNHYKTRQTEEETRKVSLNKKALDAMGVSAENRTIEIEYDIDNKRIILQLIEN